MRKQCLFLQFLERNLGVVVIHGFAQRIDLLWERNDELDLAANFEIGLSKEVEPSVTDIPRVRVQFASIGFSWQNPHGKTHRESPRLAAFRSITHQYPLGAWDLAQR